MVKGKCRRGVLRMLLWLKMISEGTGDTVG